MEETNYLFAESPNGTTMNEIDLIVTVNLYMHIEGCNGTK